MSCVYADMIRQTSTTNGTGTVDLNGSVLGFDDFLDGLTTLDRVCYSIEDGTDWEAGVGTFTDATPDTLSRSIVLGSSNAGAKVSWAGGIAKDVRLVRPALSSLKRGYIDGWILSNNGGDAEHDLDFAEGMCRDSNDEMDIVSRATITKRIDAAWAVGTGNGGLFSGAVGADTWYHCFAIFKDEDGVVDAGFDTSVIAANIPAGYTAFRRLGSVLTDDTSNILAFFQFGDDFYWDSPALDFDDSTPTAAGETYTVAIPLGVEVKAIINLGTRARNAMVGAYARHPAWTDLTPDDVLTPLATVGREEAAAPAAGVAAYGMAFPRSDTSSQIRIGSLINSQHNVFVVTVGWVDLRGKDA